jgi:hypothetical protein
MTLYTALIYTPDFDLDDDMAGQEMGASYAEFMKANEAVLRGGEALYPTASATTVRVVGGKGGDVVTTDGPYAETKEVLSGFYLLEAADLDAAVKVAAQIPAAWGPGAVEVRPVRVFDGDQG